MAASLYIGLMSGTSLDAIDAVLVDLGTNSPRLISALSHPLKDSLRQALLALTLPGDNEVERMGTAAHRFAVAEAEAVNSLLEQAGCNAASVRAIGDHGQTIRHRPDSNTPFTLQLGNAALLAELTGIDVIADFRRRDLAAGGQGAPLVPAFHNALFRSYDNDRIVINIGGIANLTYLPADPSKTILGFDTGPGNLLMDLNIQRHRQRPFDTHGEWARSGQANPELLEQMLGEPYFALPPPKSSGRELFNHHWLNAQLEKAHSIAAQDLQATLLMLTVKSITQGIAELDADNAEIYLCGGGAHNTALKNALCETLRPVRVSTTEQLGLHPDWVEATAFAWLAQRFVERRAGNLPAVTGARGERILGALYPA